MLLIVYYNNYIYWRLWNTIFYCSFAFNLAFANFVGIFVGDSIINAVGLFVGLVDDKVGINVVGFTDIVGVNVV